jgi:cyclophilin family peptidyl-prolyl cis-trans isomerase
VDAEAAALDATADPDTLTGLSAPRCGAGEAVDVAAVSDELEEAAFEIVVANGACELSGHARQCTERSALRYPASVIVRRIALVGLLSLGCRSTNSGETAHEREASAEDERGEIEGAEAGALPSWGRAAPELHTPALLKAELARRAGDPGLSSILDGAGSGELERERALWSLARIGGEEARERLLVELDAAEPQAPAAAALLEVPIYDPGSPAEPAVEGHGAWAQLEDSLWTRLALSEPGRLEQQRALLLAIARIGGSRSLARLEVELAERPGPDHRESIVARWVAATESVGLLCARGHSLERTMAAVLAGGLERRPGVDAAVTAASLYALSRCARSSAELLVESRELFVARLTPHVEAPESDEHAALAWRSFAALGELPESIPAAILSPAEAPGWTVEVEAVRALGSSSTGAALLRSRLISGASFEGPRAHVLLASLQAQRGTIASAGAGVDAELEAIAEWLLPLRRGGDERSRKLAALALCELRLLQAIRSGETRALLTCDEFDGAPAVELPAGLLANLEVEALLRATRADRPRDNLGFAELDEAAVLDDEAVIADRPDDDAAARRSVGVRARIDRLLALARDPTAARATAALQALAELDDPGVLPVLRAALVRNDPGVLAAAATAVAVRSIDASTRDLEVVPLLEQLVGERTEVAELEARLAAIEALGALARSAVASLDPDAVFEAGKARSAEAPPPSPWLANTVVPLARDPHVAVRARAREALLGHAELLREFDRLEQLAAASRPSPFWSELDAALERARERPPFGLKVTTSAGAFTIEFAGAPAPINQANLVALAEAGLFAGLSVHRVVPGFVVQGGDPRGDGYGGPGHVVPCEWSNLRYERGTVGVALAGKDTGGSQFFITQTRQPHLDARYTVVGQVGEGLEVVDRLLPGDRIEAVEVLR